MTRINEGTKYASANPMGMTYYGGLPSEGGGRGGGSSGTSPLDRSLFESYKPTRTGAILQGVDIKNTLYYFISKDPKIHLLSKHDFYRQTNGKIASIRDAKGKLKTSMQARKAIARSRILKFGSVLSDGYMVWNGYESYRKEGLTLRNELDMGIGGIGAIAGGIALLSNPVGWVATGCAVIGVVSTAYGTGTTIYDIYDEYNDE